MSTPLIAVDPLHRRNGRGRRYLLAAAGRPAQRQPAFLCRRWPPGARITAPHPGPRSPHGIDSPVGASTSWTGRCCCSASATHPTPPSPGRAAGGVRYRRPKSSSFARASRSPASTGERPLLPELCPRGWLAGREGLQRRGVVGHAGAHWSESAHDIVRNGGRKAARGRSDLPPSLWRGRGMRRSAGQYPVLKTKSSYNSTKPSNA